MKLWNRITGKESKILNDKIEFLLRTSMLESEIAKAHRIHVEACHKAEMTELLERNNEQIHIARTRLDQAMMTIQKCAAYLDQLGNVPPFLLKEIEDFNQWLEWDIKKCRKMMS